MAVITTQQTGKDVKILKVVSVLILLISFIPMIQGSVPATWWFLGGIGLNLFTRVLHWWKYK